MALELPSHRRPCRPPSSTLATLDRHWFPISLPIPRVNTISADVAYARNQSSRLTFFYLCPENCQEPCPRVLFR